jgi:hypothetical protein
LHALVKKFKQLNKKKSTWDLLKTAPKKKKKKKKQVVYLSHKESLTRTSLHNKSRKNETGDMSKHQSISAL